MPTSFSSVRGWALTNSDMVVLTTKGTDSMMPSPLKRGRPTSMERIDGHGNVIKRPRREVSPSSVRPWIDHFECFGGPEIVVG